jgi:hypothetical protein
MPCIFCIAVIAIVAGVAAATAADELEAALERGTGAPVRRAADTESMTRFELQVPVPAEPAGRRGRGPHGGAGAVPVAVTFYKPHGRLRIQVLTHDVDRATAHAVLDRVAAAAGARVVSRSDPAAEARVQQAAPTTTDPRTLPPQPGTPPPRAW